MRKDNKGFSLVELIVVIAIMAILATIMAVNIGRLSGYRAKECRSKVISSLENGRTMALSKSRGGTNTSNANTYLVFVKNTTDNCNYCITVTENEITDVKKISKGNVTLSVAYSQDASSGTPVGSFAAGVKNLSIATAQDVLDNGVASGTVVAFNRQSGGLLPTDGGDNLYHMFASAGAYQYEITIHPKTGKVEVGERTKISHS
ncbi:MAG: Tfp pilus assembly protein FimT/FimU [Lachnospiraceae bacterium]